MGTQNYSFPARPLRKNRERMKSARNSAAIILAIPAAAATVSQSTAAKIAMTSRIPEMIRMEPPAVKVPHGNEFRNRLESQQNTFLSASCGHAMMTATRHLGRGVTVATLKRSARRRAAARRAPFLEFPANDRGS